MLFSPLRIRDHDFFKFGNEAVFSAVRLERSSLRSDVDDHRQSATAAKAPKAQKDRGCRP
jgi:hypothetical protein